MKKLFPLNSWLNTSRALWLMAGIFILAALAVTIQMLLLSRGAHTDGVPVYTHYNNYLIFRNAFFHLVNNKDLYLAYPLENWDYYKYTPTFALLMAPMALMPVPMGLLAWNLLNAMLLFLAIKNFPELDYKMRWIILAIIFIEFLTSLQNAQSNALITGLMVLAFISMENRKSWLASLLIVISLFIKPFAAAEFLIFLLYPGKIRAALYSVFWFLLLLLLPLIAVSPAQLFFLYHSWINLLKMDESVSIGLSVMGFLYTWFGISMKSGVLFLGMLVLCLPLIRIKCFQDFSFRMIFLASVLIWVVIFNHKAESPTFVIAVTGVALWFIFSTKNIINSILLVLVIVFTILSPTDLFPASIRESLVGPYVLKAVPCILVWIKITWDLIRFQPQLKLLE